MTNDVQDYIDAATSTEDTGVSFINQICAMNRMYNQPVSGKPTLPGDASVRLQNFKSILLDEVEEANEIVSAMDSRGMGGTHDDLDDLGHLTNIADWLGDIIVYCTSEMVKYGISPFGVLQIIMASNFSKLGADGKPILDATGQKFLKGPDYWKPEPMIREMLEHALTLPEEDEDQ